MTIQNRSEHIFLIILVYLINLTLCVTSSENCIANNTCKCQFSNGTGIDLSAIRMNGYLFAANQNLSYYFHPCNDTALPDKVKNGGDCNNGTGYTLCEQYMSDNKSITEPIYRNLGKMEDSVLSIVSNLEAYFIFNRHNIQTTVTLVCTKTLDSYLYVAAPDVTTPNPNSTDKSLILFSPNACFYQQEPPEEMSTGSVLIILFLSFVGAYLFIGIVYRIFVAGASGIEVIPNLEFWRDLPSLVMDGVKFIQNGCKVDPLVQTNQDSYDAI